MNRIKVEKKKNYTTVNNSIVWNREISLKAKGLYFMIMTLPDNWCFTMKGLAEICKEGRDSLYNTVNELIKHGYCVRENTREKGRFNSSDYQFYETPQIHKVADNPCPEKPYTDYPEAVNPYTGKPDTEKPTQLNIYSTKENKELNKKRKKEKTSFPSFSNKKSGKTPKSDPKHQEKTDVSFNPTPFSPSKVAQKVSPSEESRMKRDEFGQALKELDLTGKLMREFEHAEIRQERERLEKKCFEAHLEYGFTPKQIDMQLTNYLSFLVLTNQYKFQTADSFLAQGLISDYAKKVEKKQQQEKIEKHAIQPKARRKRVYTQQELEEINQMKKAFEESKKQSQIR